MDFIATCNRIQRFLNNRLPCDCILCLLPVSRPYRPLQLCEVCHGDLKIFPLGTDILQHDPAATEQLICDHLTGITAIGDYAWPLSDIIQQLKFGTKLWCARTLGSLLDAQLRHLLWPTFTLTCPIPLHSKRQNHRGFNQAKVIAGHIPYLAGTRCSLTLKRPHFSLPQSELGRQQRLINVKDAFSSHGDLTGKTVLIVDDVLTTGATLDSAAKTLLNANATAVYAAVASIRRMS